MFSFDTNSPNVTHPTQTTASMRRKLITGGKVNPEHVFGTQGRRTGMPYRSVAKDLFGMDAIDEFWGEFAVTFRPRFFAKSVPKPVVVHHPSPSVSERPSPVPPQHSPTPEHETFSPSPEEILNASRRLAFSSSPPPQRSPSPPPIRPSPHTSDDIFDFPNPKNRSASNEDWLMEEHLPPEPAERSPPKLPTPPKKLDTVELLADPQFENLHAHATSSHAQRTKRKGERKKVEKVRVLSRRISVARTGAPETKPKPVTTKGSSTKRLKKRSLSDNDSFLDSSMFFGGPVVSSPSSASSFGTEHSQVAPKAQKSQRKPPARKPRKALEDSLDDLESSIDPLVSPTRKSPRTKMAPLQFWKNEKVIYARNSNEASPSVVGVLRSPE
eukprot:c11245_g1_i1.p1 GENE.c11245_g1_i1~~c11245_g1_i1.p1  ORF type:complete len:384 (+),score=94.02 c11245_g1_i1:52-1203(+)